MKQYSRSFPLFWLCGLKCGTCPKFHTEGPSRCPGCGGESFYEKHPSCSVITCSQQHGGMEYCFQCSDYPCKKYERPSLKDSFVSYRDVLNDFEKAKSDTASFEKEIEEKVALLGRLIHHYNDGRSKGFYCLAVNLLPLQDLKACVSGTGPDMDSLPLKERAEQMKRLLREAADRRGIVLELRR